MRKHNYRVSLTEFLKLFNCLASNGIHAIFGWLDLLFKDLHQERKRRKDRIPTRHAWAHSIVVVLLLFINIWYTVFFIKALIIIFIPTNIHSPYVCDLLGSYILLINNSINQITLYWSTLINYPYQHIH